MHGCRHRNEVTCSSGTTQQQQQQQQQHSASEACGLDGHVPSERSEAREGSELRVGAENREGSEASKRFKIAGRLVHSQGYEFNTVELRERKREAREQ